MSVGAQKSGARLLPSIDGPLPTLRRTFARYRLNPSRMKRLWETLSDEQQALWIERAKRRSSGDTLFKTGSRERDETAARRLLLERAIADCELVLRFWALWFGDVDRFDDRRLHCLLRAVVDCGYTIEELIWAAFAYHDYTQTNDWHRRRRDSGERCIKTCENFWLDDRLDQWVIRGRWMVGEVQKRQADAAARRGMGEETRSSRRAVDSLARRFEALGEAEQRRLIDQAVALLQSRGGLSGAADMRNLLVRNVVYGLLQKRGEDRPRNVKSARECVSEYFGDDSGG